MQCGRPSRKTPTQLPRLIVSRAEGILEGGHNHGDKGIYQRSCKNRQIAVFRATDNSPTSSDMHKITGTHVPKTVGYGAHIGRGRTHQDNRRNTRKTSQPSVKKVYGVLIRRADKFRIHSASVVLRQANLRGDLARFVRNLHQMTRTDSVSPARHKKILPQEPGGSHMAAAAGRI